MLDVLLMCFFGTYILPLYILTGYILAEDPYLKEIGHGRILILPWYYLIKTVQCSCSRKPEMHPIWSSRGDTGALA